MEKIRNDTRPAILSTGQTVKAGREITIFPAAAFGRRKNGINSGSDRV
jgi:hypothetical protein